MQYVALLRGINVGGKNRVPMADLRAALTGSGFSSVQTYIASGNVLFTTNDDAPAPMQSMFEDVLRTRFHVDTRVLILTRERWLSMAAAVPEEWQNNDEQKSDVLFLFPEDDTPQIIQRLAPKAGIDDARYVPGAVLWNIQRRDQTRTALMRIVGTDTYRNLTIRNVNTVRKLTGLLLS